MIVTAVALGALAGAGDSTALARPPNIVLIVADDMGYGDSTVFWKETELQTPAMEQIARNGIRFTQFRVNPLCSPTRSSLMTGQYSLENGMWRGAIDANAPADGEAKRENVRRFKDDVILLPQLLKNAGYATGMFGKWHLGNDKPNPPNARGFDEFLGFICGSHAYWLGRNSEIFHNGEPFLAIGNHTTDLFADHAIAFIKANKDRSFFAMCPSMLCMVRFAAVSGAPTQANLSGSPSMRT